MWQAVAGHYHSDPDVIGYEVFNEPNDFLVRSFDPELECDYGGPVHEPRSCALSHTAALPDGLIGAIQAADPNHVVFYEPSGGTDFGGPETIGIAEPLRFPRLALAFHVYGAIPAQLRETLSGRSHTRTDQPGGPPWIMDEFGASNNATASGAAAGDADGMNLSWAYWSVMQMHDPTPRRQRVRGPAWTSRHASPTRRWPRRWRCRTPGPRPHCRPDRSHLIAPPAPTSSPPLRGRPGGRGAPPR